MVLSLLRRTLVDPAPEPDAIRVAFGASRFDVAVKRSARARRMTLRVSSATGEVVLTIPARTALASAERFVGDHAGWIATRVAKLPGRVAFVPGAEVPLRGVPHRIVATGGRRAPARVGVDEHGAPALLVPGDPDLVAARVRDLLLREARADLAAAVARHTATIGIPAKRITLRDTRSRWGSCSARGHLSFSWRLILAPAFVLDYLAAHEVAHLKEMNHSARFWRLTERLCPRTDEAEAWLQRNGASLHRWGA
ncbi:M48 family metallopeptidase [Salinarimonas ramus]|uniref:Metal-dependent hydrolase n=1 Tax=Salinarimonas ramus TaxID=690164 RepID=A0A917Q976_9HYPH|nr:SprT family zinc-dependent metalloprotease [Salinarimonas ramus]GGK33784.1 metal-dependent hydrolase [Salinarimonas ramus]